MKKEKNISKIQTNYIIKFYKGGGDISQLRFNVIDIDKPFYIDNIKITPLPGRLSILMNINNLIIKC